MTSAVGRFPQHERQLALAGHPPDGFMRRLAVGEVSDEVEQLATLIERDQKVLVWAFGWLCAGLDQCQDLSAQDAELAAAGCAKVFKEKASGARSDRPELAKVIGRLEPGDVLVVTRLDRLARSTRDLLNVLDELAKRGAGFRSLKDSWADTTTPHGKLMVTVLGGLAEFERELIRARTGEGRKRAQERGVRFGRPRKLTPHQRAEALQRIAQGETQADIARLLNVSAPTISRLAAASPFEHGVAAGLG